MATAPLTGLVGHVCRTSRDAGLTDGQLLDAFLARRDEAAFECLVWRHGPAVLGACRRILQNEADAEDAFQATFLVLVRKARAVRPRDAVGAWLYGVACNVARKARADGERRRFKDLTLAERPLPQSPDPDLRPAIDFEVERLPEKYRAPIVLCELEEQPIADVAAQLGWPQGTVASRLARGRELLGKRLVRHGLGLSTLVGVVLTSESVAGVLRAVRESGVPSNRLADAVVRSMLFTKVKMMAVAIACVALVLMGGFALRMSAGEKGDPPKKAPVKADPAKPEANPLFGRWKIVKQVYDGEAMEPPGVRRVVITNQTLQFLGIGLRSPLYVWKVDPAASPQTLDLEDATVDSRVPKIVRAIHKLDGDTLTIAVHHLPLHGVPGNDKILGWPKDFGGKDVLVLTFERDKAEKADFERLVGRWRSIGGKDYKVIEFRELPHQGLMIAANAKHEADWFSWTIDERTNPRQIDVSARVEGKSNPNRGIYKFDGERLLIYLGAALQFQGDPGKHSRPEAFEDDVIPGVNYLVLEREMVAWGKLLENGLQFGVAAEPHGGTKVELDSTVEFRLYVRNTTNKAIDVDLPRTDSLLPGWLPIIRNAAGKEVNVTKLPPIPGDPVPPTRLKLKMLDYTVAELGLFKIQFVAPDDPRAGDYPPASAAVAPGEYSIGFVANKMWNAAGATGELKLSIRSTIAWGPVADGLQFGLKPDKDDYTIGDTVKLAVHARNTSDKEITFLFPTLHGWWPNNGTPIIKDADGREVKPHLAEPGGPIGPQAVTKHTVKPGEMIEVTSVRWIFVNMALPGLYKVDYAVIDKPGVYTFQYPDLHAKNKPAWPTGFARLSFKNTPPKKAGAAKPDAERLIGNWSIVSETIGGKIISDGKYDRLEFRTQPNQGLMVAHFGGDREHWFTWSIDSTQTPKAIEFSARVPGFSDPNLGVYEFSGERLRIGLGAPFKYEANPAKHKRPATVDEAAHIIELLPGQIAWGAEKDGLQFGLASANKANRLGDSARFWMYVKNTTDTPKEFEARKTETLPAYVGARAMRGNKVFKTVTALPPGGLPRPDKVSVPSRTTQVVGEFTVHFLPMEAENFGAHIVADAGKCTIDFPDLNGWLTVSRYSTGKVEIELLPWDRAHVDGLGVSWGDVVGGLQYGLSYADPTKTQYQHHDKMAVKLWARYFGAGSLEISLPVPDELWQVGRPATVLDAKGKAKPFGVPAPIPREPPGLRKHTLRSGTPVEVGTATWPIVDEGPTKAREFGVPTILADAGAYTIHFPSVGGTLKAGEVPIGTGKLTFTVK